MSTSESRARLIPASAGESEPGRKRVAADPQQMVKPTINNFSPAANLQQKLSFKLQPPSAPVGDRRVHHQHPAK
jgi:hypothetical protein